MEKTLRSNRQHWSGDNMRQFVLGIGLTALVCFAAPAKAQTTRDGNWLLNACGTGPYQAAPANYMTGVCLGYVGGISFSAMLEGVICPSDGVLTDQVVDVVIKYLLDNPAQRSELAGVLIRRSITTSFPCAARR
jgi:hypothetical protein